MVVLLIKFIVSLVVVLYAADFFVEIVVKLAKRLNVSPTAIGLSVVAVGTSLPEAVTSAVASLRDHPEIAIGNVIGSNICNVGLILGIPALFAPIVAHKSVIRKEGLLMLFVSMLLWGLAYSQGGLGRGWGIAFLIGFALFLVLVFKLHGPQLGGEVSDAEPQNALFPILFQGILSLIVLLLASEFLVSSAVELAKLFDVSENVIAISIIALGTSLPELSVAIAAVRKNQGGILVGNVIGSNLSNILLVLGIAASIKPIEFKDISVTLDMPVMIGFSFLMLFFLSRRKGITLPIGVLFLALYGLGVWRFISIPQ